MKVRIYWNLHKGMWSVQCAKTRKVMGHATQVLVREAAFTVSEAGRQRVLKERKKNVHAFVVGELEAAIWFTHMKTGAPGFWHDWEMGKRSNSAYRAFANRKGRVVSYNPFRGPHFYTVENVNRIDAAPMVYLTWENRGSSLDPKSRVVAFDPCMMTHEESVRATA